MLNRGSGWRRWEPHIHAPGTTLNDQFRGPNAWDDYLTSLEKASPAIEAVAVTDYYLPDTYEEVLRQQAAGRLSKVKLIFPNIEVRLDVAAKTGFVNLHLLVSPEDADHLDQLRRILMRLQFDAFNDRFDCTREELIRLGKKADSTITSEKGALTNGATQFKVNFAQLREVIGASEWAKNNILIAVAGAEGDGTSGLRLPADATIRQEIEKFAHVIFSSSPAQREFWLGQKAVSVNELRKRYNGCKPCLHGCDAHAPSAVGKPTGDRYSWIKGSLTFDALRQACIDPGSRAYVGPKPPPRALPSQVISKVEIGGAYWAATPDVPLNPGLIAIIGARGSGKTALADMIAVGCDAISPTAWEGDENISPSFLVRARSLLGKSAVTLKWEGGETLTRALDVSDATDPWLYPRARYLSQQFVEELCSSKGASEGLIREVERVIFEAQHESTQDGATNFEELLAARVDRHRQSRAREQEAITALSERIADEFEKEALVGSYDLQVKQKEQLLKGYRSDLGKLVIKGTEKQANRHAEVSRVAQALTAQIQSLSAQKRTYLTMQDEVKNMRASKAPEMLRELRSRHTLSGFSEQQWQEFLLNYKGDVDTALTDYVVWADKQIVEITGTAPTAEKPDVPYIPDGADLNTVKLAVLKAEMARLEQFISADNVIRTQYSKLSAKIATEATALTNLENRLADAKGAAARRKKLQSERDDAYGKVFQAIIDEQGEMTALYAPLVTRLGQSSGTLRKLNFSVTRVADEKTWGTTGEDELIDCRKAGPFYGRGKLVEVANKDLKTAWETGDAAAVQTAMADFISNYTKSLVAHAPFAPTQKQDFRAWSKSFAHWLFSTEHVAVKYEITYDGIDIRKLSPGTRGIVLLLLYLALDDADDRPLIIDQPEENLDPKSVFDELVGLFAEARKKRQVIIVTHNSNLVVNTDADQIIIANAGPHRPGGLPSISYISGGLEDAAIRKEVCDILEGGDQAFRERARRLRVRLER